MYNELTEVDIKKMQEEIEHRITVLRPQLLKEVVRTRAFGDLSENAEYHIAKQEKNANDRRIRYLQNMIKTAKVVSTTADEKVLGLFDTVTVLVEEDGTKETYRIVTTMRADVMENRISGESPAGRALLGHRVGERVKIEVNPQYSYYVKIVNIQKGSDDDSLEIR
ncbi:MAG: GreA/GreB family elongation factor [Eubacteriales bacterium]